MAKPICNRCSSADIAVSLPDKVEGREIAMHVCNACGYIWWMDMAPPNMKKVDLYMPYEKKLERENEALRAIIDNQAKVIADYQEMMVVK